MIVTIVMDDSITVAIISNVLTNTVYIVLQHICLHVDYYSLYSIDLLLLITIVIFIITFMIFMTTAIYIIHVDYCSLYCSVAYFLHFMTELPQFFPCIFFFSQGARAVAICSQGRNKMYGKCFTA